MNRELIIAAMDGKTIQWKHKGVSAWNDYQTPVIAVRALASYEGGWEVRIKPLPVPDKVWHNIVCQGGNLATLRTAWKDDIRSGEAYIVKTTFKTDENGVETKHVEIVE